MIRLMAHQGRAAGPLLWPLLLLLAACGGSGGSPASAAEPVPAPEPAPPREPPPPPEPTPPEVFGYRVVEEFPHDPRAFTQGLFFHDGFLYESTGLRGESTLRRVDLESGEVLEERELLPQFFAEGAALAGDFIFQLTWESGIGFVYTREFRLVREFRYSGEGWGLTFDGEHLVMSDGSDELRFLDPSTLRQVRTLKVTAEGEPLPQLNELEWIEGEIWANIWTEDRIARIRPDTGEVTAFVDLTDILPAFWRLRYPEMDVLNGIAWDPETDRIFVTGKKWPKLFEIELVER